MIKRTLVFLQLQDIYGWCVSPQIPDIPEGVVKVLRGYRGSPCRVTSFTVPRRTPVGSVQWRLANLLVHHPMLFLAVFPTVLILFRMKRRGRAEETGNELTATSVQALQADLASFLQTEVSDVEFAQGNKSSPISFIVRLYSGMDIWISENKRDVDA